MRSGLEKIRERREDRSRQKKHWDTEAAKERKRSARKFKEQQTNVSTITRIPQFRSWEFPTPG